MPARADLMVRPCFQQDLETVQLIYAHHVLTGTGTFEIEPPSLDEITNRWSGIVSNTWPYLVACPTSDISRVLGFAYATQFRPRAGYAKSFEDSIYVAPGSERRGIGLMLLAELISMLRGDGIRELLSLIGDSGNAASIALHTRAGFQQVGLMSNVGEKFGRFLDVVVMQRGLVYAPKPFPPPQT